MNTHTKFTKTNFFCLFLLFGITFLLIALTIPSGKLFGSETDWYCQHITIADYMRKQFLTSGELFPDFANLGGGANFYTLSYYGFFRPDILISYLLPHISMETIVQTYSILEIFLGVSLLYYWLIKKNFSNIASFTCGLLYLCANALFQAHRQIMFVNYLPFLILALIFLDHLSIQKKRPVFFPHMGIVISFFLIILHSYYFFPSCFVACTIYWWFLTKRTSPNLTLWLRYGISSIFPVLSAMFFLLPTGLTILENKKDAKGSSLLTILSVNPTLDSLLYSAYGCGLTLICLYILFLSLKRAETRALSFILFCLLFFNIFSWILNGTLYVRPKSLIPFLPLILFLTADTLTAILRKQLTHSIPLALLCILPVLIQSIFHPAAKLSLALLDWVLLLLFVGIGKLYGTEKKIPGKLLYTTVLLWIAPPLLFLSKGKTGDFPAFSQQHFTSEEISSLCMDTNARFDFLESPLKNSNFVYSGTQKKSSIYSSVSNSLYNSFFYDTLHTPISVRNRVSINANPNPFQEYLMGVRYIQTTKEKLPAGYNILAEKESSVIAENKNVLPLAYGTSSLMSEKEFSNLSFPHTLSALTDAAIIPDLAEKPFDFSSSMKPYALPSDFFKRTNTKASVVTKPLPSPVNNSLLLLSFDVSYHGRKDISVTINGIRNRLSGRTAPYPNHNTHFTYMLSQNSPLSELKISFSDGNYKITNITAYTFPLSGFNKEKITPFNTSSLKKKEILNGNIDMKESGYLVTSFAFSNGYHAFVDGKEIKPVPVNTAFVGFPIKKGTHEIVITFHAPGKILGSICSFLSILYLAVTCILSLLGMSCHEDCIFHRIRVVSFSDSIPCKSHTFIKADSRFIPSPDFQMNRGYAALQSKTYKAIHKEMTNPFPLSVRPDSDICDVSLIQNHKKSTIRKDFSFFLHYKKHSIFSCKKSKETFLRPGHRK